jgi:superfamily II DNA or RNA helicase
MRVLDEGVDVPQVSEAFLLASNTVKRQWIQRRGRVLRKCDAIGKKIAHLHDFIVIPPNPGDSAARSLLNSEIQRANEFAELAENGAEPGGSFEQLNELMEKMFN